jgi:hypothetical protein
MPRPQERGRDLASVAAQISSRIEEGIKRDALLTSGYEAGRFTYVGSATLSLPPDTSPKPPLAYAVSKASRFIPASGHLQPLVPVVVQAPSPRHALSF